ncbi:MAG: TetR/AcrR family transcriptional regulator [Bradymonadia bacterium]
MGRPSKIERDEVLNRATRLLWAQGCDAVSTRDLEQALDLRAPAIYRRFGNKDGLIAQCMEHYIKTVIRVRIKNLLDNADDPLQGLHNFFTSALEPHRRHGRLHGCLMANTATQNEGQVPGVHAAIQRGFKLVRKAFKTQIQRAQAIGQIDQNLDPEALSLALMMSMQGLLTLARANNQDMSLGIDATFHLLKMKTKHNLEQSQERPL